MRTVDYLFKINSYCGHTTVVNEENIKPYFVSSNRFSGPQEKILKYTLKINRKASGGNLNNAHEGHVLIQNRKKIYKEIQIQ